jgi:tRNA(fMet)-specific endonuclease VapC
VFLLDTNIISDLVRFPQGRAASQLVRLGAERVCTSIIVAAEVRYGMAKTQSERLLERLERTLRLTPVLPFDKPADTIYGGLRVDLERKGNLIGPNDLLIAAHALALGCTLVTDNEREFSRIRGLALENWLR